jgi:uncharacterized protein (TIGR02118 family)
MVNVTVLLSKSKDQERFDDYYFRVHVPLLNMLPNVTNVTVNRVFEVSNLKVSPYYMAVFSFESHDTLNNALSSDIGRRVYEDVSQLMNYLDHEPQILFSEPCSSRESIQVK